MTRTFFLIGQMIILFSCSKNQIEDFQSGNYIVDSTKVIYDAAFKICSLKYEIEHAEISLVISKFVQKDSIKSNLAQSRLDKQKIHYQNSIDNFLHLTNFGSNNIWNIEPYINFIRIQYLQNHLPEEYFADHKIEILSISKESSRLEEFKNSNDTTQSFMLSNLTMKVLKELDIDLNLLNYVNLKNINILVESFRDNINTDYFPCFIQNKEYNCGPACLKIIADYYNVYYSINTIEKLAKTDTSGTTFLQLEVAAIKMGFNATYKKISYKELLAPELPIIVHWNDNHFVVVYEFTDDVVKIADPAMGSAYFSHETFLNHWLVREGKAVKKGNVLEIKPKKSQKIEN